MPNVVYNEFKKQVLAGTINLTGDSLQVMLVTAAYSPNPDHAAIDDGTANDPASAELTVGGYSRKGLTGRVFAKDDTQDFGYFDAADTAFGALATGQTIAGIVLFKATGVDTTSIPIAYFDVPDTPTNGSEINVSWAPVGVGAVVKAA